MTTLYVVERVGVYRQGIVLAKATEQEAREATEAYIEGDSPMRYTPDSDGYHEFEVMRVTDSDPGATCVAVYTSDRRGKLAEYHWKDTHHAP